MKQFLFLVIITLSFFSCQNKQNTTVISNSFNWLLGTWERTNEQKGKRTFETWDKRSDTEYSGFGYTIQNSDTIWKENIKLIKRDSIWNFEVTRQGEDRPTVFRLINIEKDRFDSENQENDFPKVISYSHKAGQLNALISGGGMEISFEFLPVNGKQ